MTIQTAQQRCKNDDGRLFEPKNEVDYHAVFTVAKEVVKSFSDSYVFFWLGIHDQTNEGTFTHFSDDNKSRQKGNFFQKQCSKTLVPSESAKFLNIF